VASGAMPWWSAPPAHASCAWWLALAFLMAVVARCCMQPEEMTAATPSISSLCFLLRWRPGCSSLSFQAIVVVDGGRRRGGELDFAVWEGAHPQWCLRRGNGARFGCRQPVLTVSPLNILAEGRPFLFLPTWCLDGRQFVFESESKASSSVVLCYGRSSCGGPGVPSGNVPGDDGIGSGWEMIWTRLHFLFPVQGPPCKKQGLVCNFRAEHFDILYVFF
jgi:hypothetical protein